MRRGAALSSFPAVEVAPLSGGYSLYAAYRKDLEGAADAEKKNTAPCGKQE